MQGEEFDTDLFPAHFPDGDIFATRESSKVFLTGSAFDGADGPEKAFEIASEAFEAFASIISIVE